MRFYIYNRDLGQMVRCCNRNYIGDTPVISEEYTYDIKKALSFDTIDDANYYIHDYFNNNDNVEVVTDWDLRTNNNILNNPFNDDITLQDAADTMCKLIQNTYVPNVIKENEMTTKQYQHQIKRTMDYSVWCDERLKMLIMGISGEAGEVSELFKKYLYHGKTITKEDIINETGDLFWYIANMLNEFDITIDEVFKYNIEKLYNRYPDGVSSKKGEYKE